MQFIIRLQKAFVLEVNATSTNTKQKQKNYF